MGDEAEIFIIGILGGNCHFSFMGNQFFHFGREEI